MIINETCLKRVTRFFFGIFFPSDFEYFFHAGVSYGRAITGKNGNDVKNYWNTKSKKKLLVRSKQSNKSNIVVSSFSSLAEDTYDETQGLGVSSLRGSNSICTFKTVLNINEPNH